MKSDITTITGQLKFVGNIQTFESGFKTRTIVIEVQDGQYANDVVMELTRDRVHLVDQIPVGTLVDCAYNLGGNQSKNDPERWFAKISCWRIVPMQGYNQPQQPQGYQQPQQPQQPQGGYQQQHSPPLAVVAPVPTESDDNIPF